MQRHPGSEIPDLPLLLAASCTEPNLGVDGSSALRLHDKRRMADGCTHAVLSIIKTRARARATAVVFTI